MKPRIQDLWRIGYESTEIKRKIPPFPKRELARGSLPHPVDPQKRDLIRYPEHPTSVVSNLLIRVYPVAPGSQAFVWDETPRSCKTRELRPREPNIVMSFKMSAEEKGKEYPSVQPLVGAK